MPQNDDVLVNRLISGQREHGRLKAFVGTGLVLNTLAFGYFWLESIAWLIWPSVFAVVAWLFSVFLLHHRQNRAVVMLNSMLILVQINLATWVFGSESGLHMALWPLASIFAVNNRVPMTIAIIFAGVCLVSFATLSLYAPEYTQYYVFSGLKEILILIFGAILVSGVMSIRTVFSAQRNSLIQLANHDALTGMYNRQYFTTFLNYQCSIAIRERSTFTVAMGDIDHFKAINDTHGHDKGDEVLKHVAKCFNTYLAQSDAACRWGGEEFLVFIPHSTIEKGLPVIEALRDVISSQQTQGIKVTMSLGLVESDGTESIDALLERADQLLYQAKSAGRNNVQTQRATT
ncbi:GGDEF domain-containing protein [Glaciecola siphonariae]|uniref:diguanylate cyclase n=1 Tax=Glaciecola siphonariae TaxID=521012 RepID=A0ABV9M2T5_9ALTE